ncbi:PhnT2: putative 2-aminoethylphosphonate ABC transporter, ATP-binding protein [compost metagenome]
MQVGTPNEIYERPRHQFVAQFIGDINFLPGQLRQGGVFHPNAMPAEIPCELPGGLDPSRVQLAFRPERSKLVDPSQPHHLRAVIETVMYVGTATLYRCRLPDASSITLRESNEGGRARDVGESVAVHLPPQACLLMEA